MRHFFLLLPLMIGCGGKTKPVAIDPPPDNQLDGGGGSVVDCTNEIEEVPNELRVHIALGRTPIYQHNPPVSGEHYLDWARWQVHTQAVPRGYWVHNLEHGGVVFLYRPDAPPELIAALTRIYNAIPKDPNVRDPSNPCDHARAMLTPDPLLDVPWAVTVSGPEPAGNPSGVGFDIKAGCIRSEQALVDFAVQHRNRSFETLCDEGVFP